MVRLTEAQVGGDAEAKTPAVNPGCRPQLARCRPDDVLVIADPPEGAGALDPGEAAGVSVEARQFTAAQVGDGAIPHFPAKCVKGEPARPLAGPAGIERLEGADDRGMK